MLSPNRIRMHKIKWSILQQQPEVPTTIASLISDYVAQSETKDSEDIQAIFVNFRSRVYFYPAYYDHWKPTILNWDTFKKQCYDVIYIWEKKEEAKIRDTYSLNVYQNEETKNFLRYLEDTRQTLSTMYDALIMCDIGHIIKELQIKLPEY